MNFGNAVELLPCEISNPTKLEIIRQHARQNHKGIQYRKLTKFLNSYTQNL